MIDSDFRGIIQVLLVNQHHEKTFTVRAEDRIAQVVFKEKFNVNFHKVSDPALLGKTKRGHDGFGWTGVPPGIKTLWRRHSDDSLSLRLSNVTDTSQMKHPTTSQWYVTKTSQWYVSTTSH